MRCPSPPLPSPPLQLLLAVSPHQRLPCTCGSPLAVHAYLSYPMQGMIERYERFNNPDNYTCPGGSLEILQNATSFPMPTFKNNRVLRDYQEVGAGGMCPCWCGVAIVPACARGCCTEVHVHVGRWEVQAWLHALCLVSERRPSCHAHPPPLPAPHTLHRPLSGGWSTIT